MSSDELQILRGLRLDAIVFVLDYLQIQFENCVATFSEYPVATVQGQTYRFGDSEYRNMICGFINKIVLSVERLENVSLSLSFDDGTIEISLAPELYASPEMVVVTLADKIIAF